MNSYTFKVKLHCYNCVGDMIKLFSDNKINNVNINFDEQLVYVKTNRTKESISDLINSTGKRATLVII
jgi:copper chaperone CopZ